MIILDGTKISLWLNFILFTLVTNATYFCNTDDGGDSLGTIS